MTASFPSQADAFRDAALEQGGLFGDIISVVTHPARAIRAVAHAVHSVAHAITHPTELVHALGSVVDGPLDLFNATVGAATGFKLPAPSQVFGPIASAIASGDLSKMGHALANVAHTVADVVSFIPGPGTLIGGALNSGLTFLEHGAGLQAALEPLLALPPFSTFPPEVKDIIRSFISFLVELVEGKGKAHDLTDLAVASMRKHLLDQVPPLLRGPADELFKMIMHLVIHQKPVKAAAARLIHHAAKHHPQVHHPAQRRHMAAIHSLATKAAQAEVVAHERHQAHKARVALHAAQPRTFISAQPGPDLGITSVIIKL